MSSKIHLREPKVGQQKASPACTVEFFTYSFNMHGTPAWPMKVVNEEDLLLHVGRPLVVMPVSASQQAKWCSSFGGDQNLPMKRAFEVKLPGGGQGSTGARRTELIHVVWEPQTSLLPNNFAPASYPSGPHGAFCAVITNRAYWEARQGLLAMQEMLLDLLLKDDGVAATDTPPSVPKHVRTAVTALKGAAQAITAKPRDYWGLEAHLNSQGVGIHWGVLTQALAQLGQPVAPLVQRMQAVVFPQGPTTAASEVGVEPLRAVGGMWQALEELARLHSRHRMQRTLSLSTWIRDREAAMEYFFTSMESLHTASTTMAHMTTSSTGASSFQRGVHGAVLEEAVRRWLKERVAPLVVSTGTVMGAPAKDQLDVLIWDPRYADAVLRVGDVAYVPAPAVRGIMEVKGGTPNAGSVAQRLFDLQAIHNALCQQQGFQCGAVPVLGVLISDIGQYETVAARGANLVVPLFQERKGKPPIRNPDSFKKIMDFLNEVAAFSVA